MSMAIGRQKVMIMMVDDITYFSPFSVHKGYISMTFMKHHALVYLHSGNFHVQGRSGEGDAPSM
jgi:hypothetical protein